MSERQEWWINPHGRCIHDEELHAHLCSVTPGHVHVREVLPGDEDLFDTQVRLAELSKQHAKLVSAARAVVEFHNAVELRSAIKALKSVLDDAMETNDG